MTFSATTLSWRKKCCCHFQAVGFNFGETRNWNWVQVHHWTTSWIHPGACPRQQYTVPADSGACSWPLWGSWTCLLGTFFDSRHIWLEPWILVHLDFGLTYWSWLSAPCDPVPGFCLISRWPPQLSMAWSVTVSRVGVLKYVYAIGMDLHDLL